MKSFAIANERRERPLRLPEYCLRVEDAVMAAKPEPWDFTCPECRQWLVDSDEAASAATYAIEGREDRALAIAEQLAERYDSWLQV